MKTNRAKEIIISVIQNALIGQLDPSSNFKPQDVAEAIAVKVDFEKTYNDSKSNKIIGTLTDIIVIKREEMEEELKKLGPDEKLLSNFIHGKITTYDEILDALNTL